METTTEDTTNAAAAAPSAAPPPPPASAGRAARSSGTTFESLALIGFVFGLFAIMISVFALGLAARAVNQAPAAGSGGGGGGGPATLDVTLADFSIEPNSAAISDSGTITLTNAGATQHDLSIEGTSATSALVDPGSTGELKIDGVKPGTYTMFCTVPGHRAAGMEGKITVG